MARKKKLDKLSQDMIQCAKDGFGVHYGRWKAAQDTVVPVKDDKLPKGWKLCEGCKKPFKGKPNQRFCEPYCRNSTYQVGYMAKHKDRLKVYIREYREKRKAENNQ